jgi:propionyl-CoA synthetase
MDSKGEPLAEFEAEPQPCLLRRPRAVTASRYPEAYAAWQADPEAWWMRAAAGLAWDHAPERAFDASLGAFGQWFPGARLNVCRNALDRHVDAGRGAQPALIWDNPAAGAQRTLTYAELRDATARLAGAPAAAGVRAGDRVMIIMPMVPEAMLACARLGAVHSVVFGGFAAPELAKRIEDARPRVVVCASCGVEPGRLVAYKPLLDDAIALSAHKPERCLVLQRPMLRAVLVPGRDADLAEAMDAAAPHPCVPVAATDPLYILYTSGTTGKPKGVVRDCGGYAVALLHSMGMIYGRRHGDPFWCASDVGWVVGHSYIVYAPLLAGCTTVLYEGKPVGTPDAGAFWRVCAEHGVRLLFTAPTALRAIRQQDPDGRLIAAHDLSRLDALYLAGERCDPATATWAAAHLGVPVVDHWWQTETGWPITASFRGYGLFPPLPGSGGRACPGYDVAALDDAGAVLPRGRSGTPAVRLPLPPGCAPTLWGGEGEAGRAAGEAAYHAAYLRDTPGWYRTGDGGVVDPSGDVWVMGRTDDLINVAGHRLSTGQMEEVLASHPDVAECAVIGAADALRGQVPLGLVVLCANACRDEAEVCAELVALVRARIGPVAALRDVRVLARLPRTRSGKILRAGIRRLADGQDPNPPPTIDDPAALDDVRAALLRKGLHA